MSPRRAPHVASLLVVALAAGSCHVVFPHDPAAEPAADRALDRPRLDAPWRPEAAADLPTPADSPRIDGGGKELGGKDLAKDLPAKDLGAGDQPAKDQAAKDLSPVDQAGSLACNAATAVAKHVVTTKLVFCAAKSGFVDQCLASTLCAKSAGWDLCAASLYRTLYGGTGTPPPATDAWIAGCVRDGNNLTLPTDAACSKCDGLTGTMVPVSWDCGTGLPSATSIGRRLGLSTYGICSRVGVDDPSSAGYWIPQATVAGKMMAVCCRP